MKKYCVPNYVNYLSGFKGIRKDHYDGENALFRFSAVIYKGNSTEKLFEKQQLQLLLKELEIMSVVPNEIIIFTNRIEIHWYPKGHQMVMNLNQYLGLISQFILYIRDIPIRGIQFLERCLLEDPDRTVWGLPNELINFSPCFDSGCFGLTDSQTIKVLKINGKGVAK